MSKVPFNAYSEEEPFIFVSYAHKNSFDVFPAIRNMNDSGYRIWYDEGIEPGSEWAAQIGRHIEKCSAFVLFMSKAAAKSKNVGREISYALEHKKPILCIYLEEVALSPSLQKQLNMIQGVFIDNYEEYRQLIKVVDTALLPHGVKDIKVSEYYVGDTVISTIKKRQKKEILKRVGAVAVVILLCLSVYFTGGFDYLFPKVPDVTRMDPVKSKEILEKSGLKCDESFKYNETVEVGLTFSQSAKPKGRILRFIPVVVEVSIGKNQEIVAVPDVTGLTLKEGANKIVNSKLNFSLVASKNPNIPIGKIISQNIPKDTKVISGTNLEITVSSTSDNAVIVTMPDLVGKIKDKAEAELTQLALLPVFEVEKSAVDNKGVLTVKSQNYPAKQPILTGMDITLLLGIADSGNVSEPQNTTAATSTAPTTAVPTTASETIKIGAIQPITGPVSSFGIQSRNAINMAVEEINANGGVLGRDLEVVMKDDGNNPQKTLKAFEEMADADKVAGVIGALTSACSIPLSKEAQKRNIVMIAPASTDPTVTDAGDFIFRACFIDPFQGSVNAKFAVDNLKAKKAAIIFNKNNGYSQGLKDTFTARFKELGGIISAEESYENADNFETQLTKIKGTNPDVLFIPDFFGTADLIAKQARELGITAVMLGGDGWETIAQNAGDEIAGSYYSTHFSPDINTPIVKSFVENFSRKFGEKPTALAALAYDATYILADAIRNAGSTDPEKIKAAMMKTDKSYVTGEIKYDEKRNPVKSAVMIKIEKRDGKLAEVFSSIVNP